MATEDKAKSNDEQRLFTKITVKQTSEGSQACREVSRFSLVLEASLQHQATVCLLPWTMVVGILFATTFDTVAYYICTCWYLSTLIFESVFLLIYTENFSSKYSIEIQSVHFGSSHQHATLHTGVIYVGETQEPTCFTSISPPKHKSPAPIWEHLYVPSSVHPVSLFLQMVPRLNKPTESLRCTMRGREVTKLDNTRIQTHGFNSIKEKHLCS